MTILINTSNIKKSGALQVTLSFLEEIKNETSFKFIIVLSDEVKKHINSIEYNTSFFTFYDLNLSIPFSSNYTSYKKRFSEIISNENVDCVFSVFGPTYYTPKVPHIAGFAYPWIINPDSLYLKKLPYYTRIKEYLQNSFKSKYFRNDAQFYITETFDVKKRLNKYLKIKMDNIFVVHNTYNHFFRQLNSSNEKDILPLKNERCFRMLTVSSNFPHKNLKIIDSVIEELLLRGIDNFEFILTIPQNEFIREFKNIKYIKNIGFIAPSLCPSLYKQCDAMFLPTMLECFSATYPEAMISDLPILTSDLDFAKDICGDSALYFNPFDAKSIASTIIKLKNDDVLYKNLVEKGKIRVTKFPTSKERAQQYLKIFNQIITNNEKN